MTSVSTLTLTVHLLGCVTSGLSDRTSIVCYLINTKNQVSDGRQCEVRDHCAASGGSDDRNVILGDDRTRNPANSVTVHQRRRTRGRGLELNNNSAYDPIQRT